MEILFELLIEQLDLFNEIMLHGLQVFDILVLNSLTLAFESGFHVGQLGIFLLSDGLNHITKLLGLLSMLVVNLFLLSFELTLNDVDISFEFFIKTSQSGLLQFNELIDVNQMIS